jgi:uncharacterized phage protein gp47/JayE
MIPSSPTGLYTTAYRNKIEIRWVKNPENVKGYNIYNSTTSGGGISGYVKLNNTLIEQYSEVRKDVISTNEQIIENGGTRTTTITETFQDIFIFLYTNENLNSDDKQYYVVTAVNDLGEESPYSIEVESKPLIVTTEIVLEPLRTQNDISLDYIATLLQRTPELDVKPGAVTRQLHIDPNSREISFVYVRRDFVARSQSFLTLDQLDDFDGDRISDPVSSSSYKSLMKEAYFFDTDEEVQQIIDMAYDKLAANSYTVRKPATSSRTTLTFYTEVAPTVDLTVNLDEEVSTIPTEIVPAIKFKTLSTDTMLVSQIDNYYNEISQRYELTISAEAVEPGAIGNVNAGTIINSKIAGLQVVNLSSAFGGTDKESNASLSDRSQLAYVGLDVGTAYGYEKTVTKVPEVTDVMIVGAGHSLMQRDWDEVRNKHVFGKVDIYIKGGIPVSYQDSIGFLFKQSLNENFEIIDPYDWIIKTNNPNVSFDKPIFALKEIKNSTKGKIYDITGNWIIYKNSVEMIKTTEVTMDLQYGRMTFVTPLIAGDVITAKYDYKTAVIDEVLADPALGGEFTFWLGYSPIMKKSCSVLKNEIQLVEGTDYLLTYSNGYLQLSTGLNPGDKLITSYEYITRVLSIPESVLTAVGGELEAVLVNTNLVESYLLESDGVTVDIDETNLINVSVGMDPTDIISVSYRYRDSNPYILLKQPADSIVSIISSISGQLSESNYYFDKNDDILLEGNSAKAKRSVQILYANNIPIGDLQVFEEDVVLIDNTYKELSKKGIDIGSIIVKSGSITYIKNSDYLLKEEKDGYNIQISRSTTTTIPNGSLVTVSYEYGELMTITYNVNPLVQQVQDEIEVVRHVTADVLVKEVLETKIDFEISAVIKKLTDEVKVSNDIRTAISNELFKRRLGESVAQSDIIRAIEEVKDVVSVLVPLTKMVKADGTVINREELNVPFTIYQSSVVSSYKTAQNILLQKTLGNAANDGFYAIYEDDNILNLVDVQNDVDSAAGQGCINSDGSITVSTILGDLPDAHRYTVSYIVNGETGAKNITISDLEYLIMGEIVITTSFEN